MTPRFLFSLVAPYRARLVMLTALLLVESAVALAVPWVGGLLGGRLLTSAGGGLPASRLLAAVVGLLALQAVLKALASWAHMSVAETILEDLRLRLFDHVQAMPLLWHQGASRGDLIAMITLEIARLGEFVSGTLVQLLPLALTAAGALVLMFRIDPMLAMLVPVVVPVFFVVLRLVGRRLRRLGARIQSELAVAVGLFEEMLDLLPIIKSFRAERHQHDAFARQVAQVKALSLSEARIYALLDPAVQFLTATAIAVLLVLAGRQLQGGTLSAAETVSFLLYVVLVVRPVSHLAGVYGQIQTARGTLARLQAVLAAEPEALAAPPALAPRPTGTIHFDEVRFAYPGRPPALDGLSFDVSAGETVALTGGNGAGKTTAMGLLMGFYRPQGGRILLDGTDIATLPLATLRGAIGYVPQSRHLRNASVRDNIAFGAPGVPQSSVEAVARIAQAHAFISALPQGYDTPVGDKGVKLSGGQQQRIALARALLGDPPILILDEPTAMFDLAGEAAFVEAGRMALAGRTVLLISHRPASLALADRVLTVEGGRITGETRAGGRGR